MSFCEQAGLDKHCSHMHTYETLLSLLITNHALNEEHIYSGTTSFRMTCDVFFFSFFFFFFFFLSPVFLLSSLRHRHTQNVSQVCLMVFVSGSGFNVLLIFR